MKILILDTLLHEENKETKTLVKNISSLLSSRGYSAKTLGSLDGLAKEGDSLSNYDFIIAHPSEKDQTKLRDEMSKRNFRIIVYSRNPPSDPTETLFVRENSQLCFYGNPASSHILNLIENGW